MSSETRRTEEPPVPASTENASLLAFADHLLAAHKQEETRVSGEVQQHVTFLLHKQEFGIPISHCREILRAGAITRIPEAPAEVRGVVNLRGRIVPVVDVRTCLGLDQAVVTAKTRLVVVEIAGRLFALLVDRVARILKLASSQIDPSPDPARHHAVTGQAKVGEAAIHIVDVERMLLSRPDMRSSADKE